ncbi:MAG TPA: four helix bundle protein [Flavipsychrobacter sp.]|nr:four helix bundle protein [Flavipsychrobacter sp.]
MNNFRELKVWQKSIDFVVRIYELTKSFPSEEKFNLVSQMQRAATSIPSNISEGAGRNSKNSFKQFLTIAIGSAHELETQIIISSKLGYVTEDSSNALIAELTEIQKMLYGLFNSLD